MKSKVYIVGSINVDMSIHAERIPRKGETLLGDNFTHSIGGKGANQALGTARSGADVHMIGCIGDDHFGKEAIAFLNRESIDTSALTVIGNTSTSTAVILRTNDDNRIIVDSSANNRLSQSHVDRWLCGNPDDVLVVQYEIPVDIANYAIIEAKKKGMITVLNPAPAHEINDLVYSHLDHLILNQTECELITGIYPETERDMSQAIDFFLNKGTKNVVITLASEGCVFGNRTIGKLSGEAIKVKVADSTGAGDAFIGSYVNSLINEVTVENQLIDANIAGALTCTQNGVETAIPVREEIIKFKEDYYGR